MPRVVAGRVEELRRLEAAERALADAYHTYCRAAEGGSTLLHLGERHLLHAALLEERIAELGGQPHADADDIWIMGPAERLETLVEAERAAWRTYRDHLLDFDPDSLRLVRDRIFREHQETLSQLTGGSPMTLDHLEFDGR